MIWVLLWAAAVVAFLVFFFRGHLLWLLLWVLGLVAVIASAFVQRELMAYEGYGGMVETASRVGWLILIVALAVFASGMIVGIVYSARRGRHDRRRGEVVTGSASHFVTMESLADGSATFGERLVALDIVMLFIAFFLIWLGLGLILMKNLLVLALVPVLPGLWVYSNLRRDWQLYREAKRRVAMNSAGNR